MILTDCEPTFQGFVISDWQGIDRITNPPHLNYSYSVQAGVLAGIDMVSDIYIYIYDHYHELSPNNSLEVWFSGRGKRNETIANQTPAFHVS